MKVIVLVTTLVVFVAAYSMAGSGVVLSVKGDVTVTTGGNKVAAKNGTKLSGGDVVKSNGGTASVLFADGRMKAVKEGGELVVPKDDAKAEPDKMSTKLMAAINETISTGPAPTVTAAVRSDSAPGAVPVYPFNSAVLADELRFEWSGKRAVSGLEIFVKAPSPAYRYSFTVKAGESVATLPKDAPALHPGTTYYWKISDAGSEGKETEESVLCSFSVLSKDDAAKSSAEMEKLVEASKDLEANAQALVRAYQYLSYGLNHKAIKVLEERLKADPADAAARELLKFVFIRTKNTAALDRLK